MFFSCVYGETWWSMLKVHLSYKHTIYWRLMFWYGGRTRQFSRLEIIRALVVPGRGCHEEVITQGRQVKRRFSCGRPLILDKKRGCNRSVCTCTQTEEYSVWKYGQTIYIKDQMAWTISLTNTPVKTTPPGTPIRGPVTHALPTRTQYISLLNILTAHYVLIWTLLRNLHWSIVPGQDV